jgi:hypothetical protein
MSKNKETTEAPAVPAAKQVTIKAPNFQVAEFSIRGTAPLVQNKFSAKARQKIRDTQAMGTIKNQSRVREAKDFDRIYHDAMHISREGWHGIPASAFRHAMVDACRLADFKMTMAKMAIFILADGFGADDGFPLVRIEGTPRPHDATVPRLIGRIIHGGMQTIPLR